MANEIPQSETDSTGEAWQEIEALVDEIARLSKSELSSAEFYAEFLPRTVSGLAALGGVVWARGPSGRLVAEYQLNPADGRLLDTQAAEALHHRLAAQVLQSGQSRLVPPRSESRSESAADDPAANPTEFLLLLCPWKAAPESAGVVEVFQRPGASPKAQRGYLRFLEVVCELVADFHRHRALCDYRRRAAGWRRWEQYVERVHSSPKLRATAYAIANEGRQLIGCDRVSVLVPRGSKYRLLAVSGVDAFNRRASVVRHLEKLANAMAVLDEPLWHPSRADQRPPEVDLLLNAYLDESHARALVVMPLKPPETEEEGAPRREPVGVLVAERFYGALDEGLRGSVTEMCGQTALALRNAMEAENVPLVGALRALGRLGWFVRARQLPKTVLALLAIGAAAAALILVPAELRIEARGELQPLVTRDVFAPADAVVAELHTAHARQVRADQVLLALRKPELDFEFKRVWGELQTARKKLKAAEAEQLLGPRDAGDQRRRSSQLTAQQEELREMIGSLDQQHAILQQKLAELEVRSPMAGEVLTWNLQQLLEARPVSRGQVLMTIADLAGPWVLELRVPDHRVAHVLTAQGEIRQNLDVSFVLATEPGAALWGELDRVGMRTEVTESEGAFVLARVKIDRDQILERMPGATVTAKIHCGRRCLGYVWLHELIDAVQSWLLF